MLRVASGSVIYKPILSRNWSSRFFTAMQRVIVRVTSLFAIACGFLRAETPLFTLVIESLIYTMGALCRLHSSQNILTPKVRHLSSRLKDQKMPTGQKINACRKLSTQNRYCFQDSNTAITQKVYSNKAVYLKCCLAQCDDDHNPWSYAILLFLFFFFRREVRNLFI